MLLGRRDEGWVVEVKAKAAAGRRARAAVKNRVMMIMRIRSCCMASVVK